MLSLSRALQQLKKYGVAGVLAYGLLNTVYYITAFGVVWVWTGGSASVIAPAAAGVSPSFESRLVASATAAVKVLPVVWAASQVGVCFCFCLWCGCMLARARLCSDMVVVAAGHQDTPAVRCRVPGPVRGAGDCVCGAALSAGKSTPGRHRIHGAVFYARAAFVRSHGNSQCSLDLWRCELPVAGLVAWRHTGVDRAVLQCDIALERGLELGL